MARPVVCQICHHAPPQAQYNSKYCRPCRTQRRRRPRSNVTPAQADQLRPLLGTMPVLQICERVGLSKAAYQRWRREEGITLRNNAYRPETVEAVVRTYAQAPQGQGKHVVREQFPDVRVRSIVERYTDFAPRQIRWTAAQMREAAKMAGLVSHRAQARYFRRPYANDGSIKALWMKRFGCGPSAVNGLGVHVVWRLVTPGCPAVLVLRLECGQAIAKILWVDMAQHLRPDVSDEVRACITMLARFQGWLHGTEDSAAIRAMISEREQQYGGNHEHPGGHERSGARAGALRDGDGQCEKYRPHA